MKKIVITAGLIVTLLATACGGEAPNPTLKDEGVEEIIVEEIQVEEIRVEEIRTENIYIDDCFSEELEYNSKVNTWDNGTNITRWD